ncbi:MAG: elongation factor P, partial [Rhodobiaceae bacterium]
RVRLEQSDYQFLFEADGMLTFMNTENYEQIELDADFVGDRKAFLQDGMMVVVESFEDKPIGVRLPDQVTLEVRETEPVVKGQTAASSNKPAMLENDVRIMVPPFVEAGDRIVVNTEELTYLK